MRTRKYRTTAKRPARYDLRRSLHSGKRKVMSEEEYNGLVETIHLLRNPANAKELLSAIAEANEGKFVEGELIEE